MKWFFCLDDGVGQFDLARVAVLSCQEQTRLTPHCLYSGSRPERVAWFTSHGVTVHPHPEPTVAGTLRLLYPDPRVALAAYLRVDVPLFCEPDDDFVLYTDVDVLFVGDCKPLSQMRPANLSISRDLDPTASEFCNSGVLLLNAQAMKVEHATFTAWVRAHAEAWLDWDQESYRRFYIANALHDELPLEFNWRAFWHANWAIDRHGNCLPRQSPVQIVHFQIVKPWHADSRFGTVKHRPEFHVHELFRWRDAWRGYHARLTRPEPLPWAEPLLPEAPPWAEKPQATH